jgi:hypothetical protein
MPSGPNLVARVGVDRRRWPVPWYRSPLRRALVRTRHAARADDAEPVVASDPTDALVL